MEYKRIAVDTSKAVFTVHGIDANDRPVLRRNLKRAEFEAFFAKLPPTEVAMEVCGSSHHWARTLAAHGHQLRLLPPQYVKPFVKRGKNDSADAEAICEAAGRPGMHFVPVKSAARQAAAMPLSVRELLVRQRTQLVNALRGHASEFGIIAGRGIGRVDHLLEQIVASEAISVTAREMLMFLCDEIAHLDDKQRLGGISREGNERLRQLFVVGAMAVIRQARPGSKTASPWVLQLLERRPRKLVAVALANKMARTAWAMMTSGEAWRMPKASVSV